MTENYPEGTIGNDYIGVNIRKNNRRKNAWNYCFEHVAEQNGCTQCFVEIEKSIHCSCIS